MRSCHRKEFKFYGSNPAWQLAPTPTRHGSWFSLGGIVPGILLLLGMGVENNHDSSPRYSHYYLTTTTTTTQFFFFRVYVGFSFSSVTPTMGNLRYATYYTTDCSFGCSFVWRPIWTYRPTATPTYMNLVSFAEVGTHSYSARELAVGFH